MKHHNLHHNTVPNYNLPVVIQKQPFRGVPKSGCSENIYSKSTGKQVY